MHPALLRKADRGKFHDLSHVPAEYGREVVADGVQGIELLEAFNRGEIKINDDGNAFSLCETFLFVLKLF